MGKMIVLIRKEILELWRTKKIIVLSIIFLFIAISSPIIAKLTPELLKSISTPGLTVNLPEPTYKESIDQFIKNISQIVLLVLIFTVAGIISDEKTKKTLEIVLTKPISRVKFILSKFVSSFLVISAIFIVVSVIFYAYTTSVFSTFSFINFSVMALTVLTYILMIASITLLASTIVKNSIIAGGIGFVSYIMFGLIIGLFDNIKIYSPNLIFSNYQAVVAHGWTNDLICPIIVMITVITISVISSIMIFRLQEIDR